MSNDNLLCYSKRSDDGKNIVMMVINLDPNRTQAGMVDVPLERFGLSEGATLSGE